ncbi:subtilisin family serine protease [Streptomyces sp. 2132.2]|uniref:S8 family peptidase n=1 Tax=Streptomyces sp. 2132.2 TaxID=2485161 RepID=UPI000C17D1C2|nr:S8 family peptidase [Streptomyces sp. 2132.2]ROQ97338.1 subtilisin family serine protease [Streptomyces sp. 2132.2]
MRLLARLATAALLTVPTVAAGSAAADTPEPTPVPLHTSANAVPGKYIVTLEKGVDAATAATKLGLKPSFVYSKAMNGFAVPLTPLQLQIVRVSLGVKSVEEDAKVKSVTTPSETPGMRAPSTSWGLDRIDQREWDRVNGKGDGQFTTTGNGTGVTAYILDTGIDYTHDEFGGRATFGFDAMGDGRNGLDCNGHGTHVAGTVAGKTYGVARKANLVSVRVLGCDGTGTYSGMIAGLDWVAKNAKQPAVLNGSLGGDKSVALNDAATALSDAGVLPVIAAGNSSKDACYVSPASADRVFTVGASNKWDEETSFSNYGNCLEVYAPGEAIVSAKLGGGSVEMSGTSMAAPHVAGVAVLYKQAHPTADPAELAEFLETESTKDVLTNISKASPNMLLFTAGL